MSFASIHKTTGDGRANAVIGKPGLCQKFRLVGILDDRINVPRAFGTRFEMMKALAHAPAVVATLDQKVYFFPPILL